MKASIRTIGKAIAVLVALLATSGFSRHIVQPQTVIRVSPSTVEAKVGQELTVDVEAMQVSGLYGVEFRIRFDPAVLEVVDAEVNQLGVQIEPGSFPSPDFVVRNAADNQGGTIDYAATQLQPSKPSEGDGTVARITFLAKKAATSRIRLEKSLLADHQGNSIQAVSQSGEIKVLGSPTRTLAIAAGIALLVLVGGGIGFIITRRK